MMDLEKSKFLGPVIAFSKLRKVRSTAQTRLSQKMDIRRRYVFDQEERVSVQEWWGWSEKRLELQQSTCIVQPQ